MIPGQEYTGVWRESEWSDCSGACDGGSGTRERGVTCEGGNFLCDPDTQPDASEECVNNEPCCTSWYNWGNCSSSCGTGMQTRTCRYDSSVTETQFCEQHSESACCGSWSPNTGNYECGVGFTQNRTCQSNPNSYSTSRSATGACHTHRWGFWGSCEGDCGGGEGIQWRRCLNPGL